MSLWTDIANNYLRLHTCDVFVSNHMTNEDVCIIMFGCFSCFLCLSSGTADTCLISESIIAIQLHKISLSLLSGENLISGILMHLVLQWKAGTTLPRTSRSLASSSQQLVFVPSSRLNTKSDRAFSVAAPKFWNNLPSHPRSCPIMRIAKSQLKTYVFNRAFGNVWGFSMVPCSL